VKFSLGASEEGRPPSSPFAALESLANPAKRKEK
jgi:hypothetical protein